MGGKAKNIALTERQRKALERLRDPLPAEDLEDLYSSRKTMYRELARLKQLGLIRVVGYLGTGGRPQEILCTRPCRGDAHAVELSRFLQTKVDVPSGRGGPHDCDAVLYLPLADVLVEWDRATESLSQVEDHLRRMAMDDPVVLFVTTDEARRDRVLARCSFLSRLLGTTVECDEIINTRGEKKSAAELWKMLGHNPTGDQTEDPMETAFPA
jgi:hypothetical protein